MATVAERPITADELLMRPDDGFRHELIKGELTTMAPAGFQHGVLAGGIHTSLGEHVRKEGLGVVLAAETGFKIGSNPDTVRAPDVAFVSREHFERVGPTAKFWPGAPDLAVEVLSPGDTYSEVQDKVFDWLKAGTRMVAVVDPRKRVVTVYRSPAEIRVLTGDDMLDGGDVVPGWRLPLSALFASS
jgi:Uma2 family endonuclease